MAHDALGQDSLVGQTLGHYRIVDKIGEGGMGVVYRAHDEHLDREVAIKVLPPGILSDERSRKRFRKEALALSKLNHPNIATIHDFDTQADADFLVMEYIPGVMLNDKLAKGPLPEKEIIALGTQLGEGLWAAHEHGVVHRDLKPGNLRLTTDGRVKILDFGLAKLRVPVAASAATESMSQTETLAGTLPYMAPEQLLGGEIDIRTDIHAAGLVLYEMATGKRAFAEFPSGELIGAIVHHSPVPPRELNHELSPELDRIVEKCLEKDPANRYQSAKEFAVDLRRLEHDSQTGHAPSTPHAALTLSSFRRSKRATLVGSAIVLALVAVLLTLPALRRWEARRSGNLPRFRAIAVLPLVNLSGDPSREYFADGMTEELITQLGRAIPARIISRQSVMQFKGTKMSLADIAQKLKVDAIVEGSVVLSGSRVRVTARLIDAAAEAPVWSDEYERDLRDVLGLQGEVTGAIANEIRVKLTPQEQARLAKPRSVNPEAYEAYLNGRFQWSKISKEGIEEAERYFQLALEKDPDYALAYSGLADIWMMRTDSGYASPAETMPKAKAAALKAIQLDDTLSEPRVSLAIIEEYERDWLTADRDYQRAIQLNPSNATAHFMYADYLISLHRNQEWQTEIQRALALDPMNYFLRCFYGWHLIYLGRYDEAIDLLQKVAANQPKFSSAHMGLWGAYYKKHMDKEALEEAVKFFEALNDRETVAALTTGFRQAGYREAMSR
ncbi:MAG: protein kinase domain-containing protein, partial [Terriglobales bacterium]